MLDKWLPNMKAGLFDIALCAVCGLVISQLLLWLGATDSHAAATLAGATAAPPLALLILRSRGRTQFFTPRR